MSIQRINIGSAPNDGTGDTLRTAASKANAAIDRVNELTNDATLSDAAASTTLPAVGGATPVQALLQSLRNNVKSVFTGSFFAGSTSKTTPVDADSLPIVNSEASGNVFRLTFANLYVWILWKISATGITVPSLNGGQLAGHRNVIINGACEIAQAASFVASNGLTGYGGPDMFVAENIGGGGQFAQSQQTLTFGGATRNTARHTVNTAISNRTGSNYWAGIGTRIEARRCRHLLGSPAAISFIFNANVAGTYPISLALDGTIKYSYVTTFTVAANTPTRIIISLPALPVAANTPIDSSIGMILRVGALNVGTYQSATPNTWATGATQLTTSADTNWAATAGNFIELTELQLELGAVATPFERRDDVLQQCQRYYEIVRVHILGSAHTAGAYAGSRTGFRQSKRTVPTVGPAALLSAGNINGVSISNATVDGFTIVGTGAFAGTIIEYIADVPADARL